MADAGSLPQRVQSQMLSALRSGEKARTQVLRMVLAEIKQLETDKPGSDPQQAVNAYAKKLKKAATEFEQLGQTAAASDLRKEIAIVEEFLPKQLDDAATAALVDQTLAGMGPVGPKDAGRVMGAVMKAAAGAADAARVKAAVEKRLAGS